MMGTLVFLMVVLPLVAAGIGIYSFIEKCAAYYKELDQ
jgi:hypothetical protein